MDLPDYEKRLLKVLDVINGLEQRAQQGERTNQLAELKKVMLAIGFGPSHVDADKAFHEFKEFYRSQDLRTERTLDALARILGVQWDDGSGVPATSHGKQDQDSLPDLIIAKSSARAGGIESLAKVVDGGILTMSSDPQRILFTYLRSNDWTWRELNLSQNKPAPIWRSF